jgi:hypothetical protein
VDRCWEYINLLLFIQPQSAGHHQLRGLKKHFFDIFLQWYKKTIQKHNQDARGERLVAAVASASANGAGVVAASVPAAG